jgi:hypothetical protein
MSPNAKRLIVAWLATAIADGLFACILSIGFYHSTFTRLWQGVASVLLGPTAMQGGNRTMLIGLAMHFLVAFTWSAIFLFGALRLKWVRDLVKSPGGIMKTAALYGPFVWIVMSMLVIPILMRRLPTFTMRWLVQLIGHAFSVGLPIVASTAGRARE